MIFYTVYRTQNICNGHYYFGVHKTKNPYDGYLGSGKILKRAIAKYGERSFIKNVCFIFDNPEEAFAKEFELIETYREDPLCYNLRQGGSGGFDWINREGNPQIGRRKGIEAIHREAQEQPGRLQGIWADNGIQNRDNLLRGNPLAFLGRKHTEEAKRRIGLGNKRSGERNSQFGTCWVTKEGNNRKVKKAELEGLMQTGWKEGRKIKVSLGLSAG